MKRFPLQFFQTERNERREYPVKGLGSVLCSHPGVEEICRAMREKYTASRQHIGQIPCQKMTVSSKGIELQKVLKKKEVRKFVIERIVYSGVDELHKKIFAFFYRSPDNLYGGLDCHVFECHSKKDAKQIALKISDIFHHIAETKQQERGESSLTDLNLIRERTVSASMMQLQSSVETLLDGPDSCPGSPKIERRERRLNYSELQLHTTPKLENSSGYGDSSDDLTNNINSKTKRRKHKGDQSRNKDPATSKILPVKSEKMDYVNAEIGLTCHENSSSSSDTTSDTLTLLLSENKDRRAAKKDRNDNSYQNKHVHYEYMNMKRRVPKLKHSIL